MAIYRIAVFLTCAFLVSVEAKPTEASSTTEENGNMKVIARLLNDCGTQENAAVCFKTKAVNFLDRLIKSPGSVPITDYVYISQNKDAVEKQSDNAVEDSENIEKILPRSMGERSDKLDELLWKKFATLLNTRTIQFNVPNNIFEGRKKDKKKGGMMVMMMAGMMMKMMMAKVMMMAGKAMVMGKIALILTLIMAVKKMGGGGGGGESHPQVVYATAEHGGGGGGGGWQRRYMDAQHLAYGASPQEEY